ncbi:iron-containing alcohol dehydrogenase [Paraliomyxa miuraensis]|uniref:iron-containing alcohol dehydrogenase n=1 Tax=Paraliomyxa miuraensis TaxID=376150 RepID=UPI0022578384|nr:iron-containing alcohol dehydrogenase [Paraliomyxa miuraensis]MCX4247059.1 iron-containing alcohol dehydrogenase [Paraliomyxa miuraensis]
MSTAPTAPTAPRGNFNYPTAYRIGAGRRVELAAACKEVCIRMPLVVTDPGVARLPWFSEIVDSLREAGLPAAVFSDVPANPDGACVEAGVAVYRSGDHDGVVVIGGGSAMDAGKCVALMAGNKGTVFDYEDVGDNWKRADPAEIAPIVAMPTTSGTGSEVGRASVIVDARDHNKKIIFHPKMQPSLVLADPELTVGLPPFVTAATGMDALAHCFEAWCAPGYHPMADGIALEGMWYIRHHLPRVFADGSDIVSRTHMMMAASMGATAFQKGLGMVHSLSHPLGGATGIHHGLANAIFLPYVMEFNREVIEDKMDSLSRVIDLPRRGFDGVMEWMLGLRKQLGLAHTLAEADIGFDEAMARRLAPLAAADPSQGTNPKEATVEQLEGVFLKAWRGELAFKG